MSSAATLSGQELEDVRRSRRHPRRNQFDYLHLRCLVRDLGQALDGIDGPVHDVLDIYCGSRPYDDLLPAGARCVGLDVEGNPYGVADVVSNEFLPFPDASFDLVTSFEAFHYVEDPHRGVAEIRRVLRPGGSVVISVPHVWEYDSTILEHRYTGPELIALFDGWDQVEVVENGGRVVVWTTVTGTILEHVRARVPRLLGLGRAIRASFGAVYLALNLSASMFEALEARRPHGKVTLPMNLLLTARRPVDAENSSHEPRDEAST